MRYSYSRVDCYNRCPRKYKYRYIDKLHTLPDQRADNALYLGTGLHKGIETTVEEGVAEYRKNFYVLTNEIENWTMQLEYWIPRVKAILPRGRHEVKVSTPDFIGFIDYVSGDTLMDFKFSNNIEGYLESDQLSLYKYYFELTHPKRKINHLKYVFIPKCNICQKKTESIIQFRDRLKSEMEKSEIKVVEVPYDDDSITRFLEDRKTIETDREFLPTPNAWCERFCEFYELCMKGEEINLV